MKLDPKLIKPNASGKMIATARKKKGFSGSDSCRMLNLKSLGLFSAIENGHRRLTLSRVKQTAELLDLDPSKLFNAIVKDMKADLNI